MKDKEKYEARQVALEMQSRLSQFVAALMSKLDEQLDKRLVRTFLQTLQVILMFRHSSYGLLLSELGGYLASPAHAPAGTKRLSNLLRSPKWAASLIEEFLWEQARQRWLALREAKELVLLVWDDSILEKAESIALEGLCAVRSSVSARLKRIKPGFYNPPGGKPVFVPGLNWLSVVLVGLTGVPSVVTMEWWTTRGKFASDKRSQHEHLLQRLATTFGEHVLHVFDRGFAGAPWLHLLFAQQVRFVIRWPKAYQLIDARGVLQNAWKIARGKRAWQHRMVYDARRRCYRSVGFLALEVTHPDFPTETLWLVVSRQGHGHAPWYLLTNQPIFVDDDAWQIVLAYTRRWHIEMTFRYAKAELALESPRLWSWHNRLKLLLMTTLVYAFLLSLLDPTCTALTSWLLRHFCHRTGKRSQVTLTPLYRLRSALSRLWLAFQPPFQNSG